MGKDVAVSSDGKTANLIAPVLSLAPHDVGIFGVDTESHRHPRSDESRR